MPTDRNDTPCSNPVHLPCRLLGGMLVTVILLLSWTGGAMAQVFRTPTSGSYRAVVVFVRFQDDTQVFPGVTRAQEEWALPDQLPAFSGHLLADSPVPPFPEQSLTAYFYQQSQGRFTLYGDIYPRVLVSEHAEEAYRQNDKGKLDLGHLSEEILTRLQDDPAFDLGQYDANGDGYLDQIFIVVRKLNRLALHGAGVSYLGYDVENPTFGNDPQHLLRVKAAFSGVYLDYSSAGIIFPDLDLVRLMAHEFAHNWGRFKTGHLVPMLGGHTAPANGWNRIGYALMAGHGGKDTRGDMTLSAYERDDLRDGWITCHRLATDTTVVITDLYTDPSANCYTLLIPFGRDPKILYLSNRQRIGFFDRLQRNDATASDHGLMTTGLLPMLTYQGRTSVLAADNTLDLSAETRAYQGDLYGPETKTQLTPWTRPNINGYATTYPADFVARASHFKAIDEIRYTDGPNGEMTFRYVRDFRRRPVIRADSWIGPETAGYTFTDTVVVTGGSTLTLETALTFTGTVRVEKGCSLVIEDGATVYFAPGSVLILGPRTQLVVRGTLTMDGTLDDDPSATHPWKTATVEAESAPERHTDVLEAYPTPFNVATTIHYELSSPGPVRLIACDLLGREVAVLVNAAQPAGRHHVVWDAQVHAAGIYLVRLTTRQGAWTRKVLLVR